MIAIDPSTQTGAARRTAEALERYDTWMRTQALPLWSTTGISPEGGSVERLTLAGARDRAGFKRLRVQARQIYVFSHAHLMGMPSMLAPARAAYDFMVAHGRSPEGGWVYHLGDAGGVVDGKRDLYCQAFVVLALAWWHRASGEEEPLRLAQETLDTIDTAYGRDDRRGWICCLPDHGEFQQNPHMHLFEALLALHAVAPDARTEAWLHRIRALFTDHLFDAETSTLGEFFDAEWQPLPGARGQHVEPGHHYEWVWLLHQAEKVGVGSAEPAASALFAHAERHGLAPGALIYDDITRDGQVTGPDSRCWPQTERIKALLALGEASGTTDLDALCDALDALWTHYLAPATQHGAWIDHVTADHAPRAKDVPASTLYHLYVAYAELVRCAPALFQDNAQTAAP